MSDTAANIKMVVKLVNCAAAIIVKIGCIIWQIYNIKHLSKNIKIGMIAFQTVYINSFKYLNDNTFG